MCYHGSSGLVWGHLLRAGKMSDYRVYRMDGTGRIHYAEPIDAVDDEEAVRKTHALKIHALKCEVWSGDRLVASLDAKDLA
jgi:hypothetical protein